jgi:hypothetical protein
LKCEYSCRTFHSLSLSASRTECSHTLTSTARTALFCQIYTCPWSFSQMEKYKTSTLCCFHTT